MLAATNKGATKGADGSLGSLKHPGERLCNPHRTHDAVLMASAATSHWPKFRCANEAMRAASKSALGKGH
jgi:hypothetical protein